LNHFTGLPGAAVVLSSIGSSATEPTPSLGLRNSGNLGFGNGRSTASGRDEEQRAPSPCSQPETSCKQENWTGEVSWNSSTRTCEIFWSSESSRSLGRRPSRARERAVRELGEVAWPRSPNSNLEGARTRGLEKKQREDGFQRLPTARRRTAPAACLEGEERSRRPGCSPALRRYWRLSTRLLCQVAGAERFGGARVRAPSRSARRRFALEASVAPDRRGGASRSCAATVAILQPVGESRVAVGNVVVECASSFSQRDETP